MHDIPDDMLISPEGLEYGHEDAAIVCFRCGLCCTYYRVFLTLEEAQRISDYSRVPLEEFIEEYGSFHWYEEKEHLLLQKDGGCFFLKRVTGTKEFLCGIHPVKPRPCRDWTPGLYRRECQRGLAEFWNLTINPAGQMQGEEEDIERFNSFLKSIEDEEQRGRS